MVAVVCCHEVMRGKVSHEVMKGSHHCHPYSPDSLGAMDWFWFAHLVGMDILVMDSLQHN